MNILVIGAGPTGLMAALALSAHHISCRIVERRTTPSALSRAVGIMPVTIEALQTLGAADEILAEAMVLRKIQLTRAGQTLMALDNTSPAFSKWPMRGLPQNRTEEILRDVLATRGVKIEYELAAEKITTDTQQAVVQFSDGSEGAYAWVIAADGIQSLIREQLGIAYPGHDLADEWSIADIDVAGDFDPEQVSIDVQAEGGAFSMILPIEARRARLVSSTPDALSAMSWPLEIANIRRTGTFNISLRQAETYRKGRVLLAGDAAHCHSPVGGKGMNLGMADARAAVQAIVTDQVDTYSSERHRVGATVLKNTERARKLITATGPFAKAMLSMGTKAISALPAARQAFLRNLSQI